MERRRRRIARVLIGRKEGERKERRRKEMANFNEVQRREESAECRVLDGNLPSGCCTFHFKYKIIMPYHPPIFFLLIIHHGRKEKPGITLRS